MGLTLVIIEGRGLVGHEGDGHDGEEEGPAESDVLHKTKDLLLIQNIVHRINGKESKVLNRQVFERAANLGPYLEGLHFCVLLLFA